LNEIANFGWKFSEYVDEISCIWNMNKYKIMYMHYHILYCHLSTFQDLKEKTDMTIILLYLFIYICVL
jgi:hypothetical protein